MAARAEELIHLDVLDLRHFQARDLAPLLDEESRTWSDRLRWDFQPSADIVRRYLDLRALNGYVLLNGKHPVGYSYYIHEDHKILIGDLFVSEMYRSSAVEHRLLRHVVEAAQNTPGVRRIEAQLMMLQSQTVDQIYPSNQIRIFDRDFMLAGEIGGIHRGAFGPAAPAGVVFEPWTERFLDPVAELIAGAYQTHVDSRINDQYRSIAGARRFLHNIVQYPGCGSFFAPAAVMAVDTVSQRVCGISLTSLVAPRVGHVTQICVSPDWRGRGVGAEMLWRSMQAFGVRGCEAASLTVTSSNTRAVRLYQRVGFRTIGQFQAYVWENFV